MAYWNFKIENVHFASSPQKVFIMICFYISAFEKTVAKMNALQVNWQKVNFVVNIVTRQTKVMEKIKLDRHLRLLVGRFNSTDCSEE